MRSSAACDLLAGLRRWLVLGIAALALAAPGTARADADPASDVLLGENVFYPYQPAVSAQLQRALNGAASAASHAGFPVHVALIGAPFDLGAIPGLFGKPQQYASFLDREISYNGPVPVLVVMPAGYGVAGTSKATAAAAASLPRPGKTSDLLARAAITAVEKLAAADGHPITHNETVADQVPRARGSGGISDALLVAILLVVSVSAASAALMLHRRGTTRR